MSKKGKSKYQNKFSAGHTFGSWTVVDGKVHGSPARMDVLCACGTKKRVDVYTLVNGTSMSCGCIRPTGEASKQWTGINGIPGTVLYRAKQVAERHGNIVSKEQLASVYLSQGGSCSLTNQPLTSGSARLARYDNSISYTPDNVTWVHSSVSSTATSAGVSNVIQTVYTVAQTNPNIFEQMGMKPIKKETL